MKKIGIKIFAYIAVVLMLASVFPAVALADSDNGKKNAIFEADEDTIGDKIRDRDRDRVNATEDAPRTSTMNQAEKVKNAQAQYAQAKKDFLNAKAKNNELDSEEAINATKDYLNSTIAWMIESLDAEEDADYIAALNAEKEEIGAANSRDQLAESAKDIRDIWKEARKDRVSSAAKSVNNKLNAVIKKSENMAQRLDKEIARMEQDGEDVTELQAMLDEYNDLIAEAKEYQEEARNAYTNGNENGEALRNMNQAGQSIKDANAVLKSMLQALKQHREGLVVLTGEGTLEADGDGTAVISGNFSLNFNATDAKLVIKDMAGDADINTTSATFDSSNVDSGNSDDNNRAFVYHNLTGDVTIEGSRLTVMLRGTDMDLEVEGKGTAMLSGEGEYAVNGGELKKWAMSEDEDEEVESEEEETEEQEVEESGEEEEGVDNDSSDDESSDEEEDDESSDDESTHDSSDEDEDNDETSGSDNETST